MARKPLGGAMGAMSAALNQRNGLTLDQIIERGEKEAVEDVGQSNILRSIDTGAITPWKYANRPEDEIDAEELAEEFLAVGQKVPALVRPTSDGKGFELIYGRRRFEACLIAGIPLLCIVVVLSDSEAHAAQWAENNKRKDLSPYANALDFKRALDNKIYRSQSELAKSLGVDRSTVNEHLCYFKIPDNLAEVIGSMSNVSLRTAKIIARNADNDDLISTLIQRSDEIADGKLTDTTIKKMLEGQTQGNESDGIVASGEKGQLFRLANSRISLSKYASKLATDQEIKSVLEDFLKKREQELLDGPTNQ